MLQKMVAGWVILSYKIQALLKRVGTSWGKTKIPLCNFFPQGNGTPWKFNFFYDIKNILENNFLYKVMGHHENELFLSSRKYIGE